MAGTKISGSDPIGGSYPVVPDELAETSVGEVDEGFDEVQAADLDTFDPKVAEIASCTVAAKTALVSGLKVPGSADCGSGGSCSD